MAKKKTLTRRELLKAAGSGLFLGTATSPFATLFESIFQGALNQAVAEQVGYTAKSYLMVQMAGAPPRWTYDLPLAPNGDADKIRWDRYIGTKFVNNGGRYTDLEYATHRVNIPGGGFVDMPYIWQFPVPRAGGGTRPMTQLLENMLMVRGINCGNPTHFGAQTLQFLPGTSISTGALATDGSNAPIPAVTVACSNFEFKSAKNLSVVVGPRGGNILRSLLEPFLAASDQGVLGFRQKQRAIASAVNTATDLLDARAANIHSDYFDVKQATDSAKQLIAQGFANIDDEFNARNAKYSDLISRALSNNTVLVGINDRPIGTSGARNADYKNGSTAGGADLRGTVSTPIGMAAYFAVAEYLLVNRLSSYVAIAPGNLRVNGVRLGFDEHGAGRMISMLGNTYYARCFAACMLELIDRLKAAGIYNDTIIQVAPEFGRMARAPGDKTRFGGGRSNFATHPQDQGTDHADDGGVASFHGGAIKGYQVTGNISSRGSGYASAALWYPGTYGKATNNLRLNGQNFGVITHRHIAATLATMIGAPSPVSNATPSVVANQGGQFVSLLERAKIT